MTTTMPVSFVDALYSRYADPKYSEVQSCELFIIGSLSPGKSGNNLILPPGLSLNGCAISTAGSESKIRDICANVEELDLASNHITDLREVYGIVRWMPNLRFLNLSENHFSRVDVINRDMFELTSSSGCDAVKRTPTTFNDTTEEDVMATSSFLPSSSSLSLESVKSLVLNNTRVPWIAVNHLLQSMPNLQELHLSLNNYTSMEMPNTYPNITRLYISGNPDLSSFDEISNLVSAFPQLEGLTMADCNVSSIPLSFQSLLPHLQSLNITNWPIDDWESLERLNNLPNLSELRCQGVKVLESIEDDDSRRHHLISRLPHIKRLNGSEISDDERMFAEKAFVGFYLVHDDLPRPPRFHVLHSIYGRVDPMAEVDLSPPKSAQVTVVFSENSSDNIFDTEFIMSMSVDSQSPATKVKDMTVNLNKSVKDFKQRLSTIFGLPASRMRVFYVDHVMMEIMGPEEMKFNQKKLYTYNVQDGDKFVVDAK